MQQWHQPPSRGVVHLPRQDHWRPLFRNSCRSIRVFPHTLLQFFLASSQRRRTFVPPCQLEQLLRAGIVGRVRPQRAASKQESIGHRSQSFENKHTQRVSVVVVVVVVVKTHEIETSREEHGEKYATRIHHQYHHAPPPGVVEREPKKDLTFSKPTTCAKLRATDVLWSTRIDSKSRSSRTRAASRSSSSRSSAMLLANMPSAEEESPCSSPLAALNDSNCSVNALSFAFDQTS